MDSSSSVNTSFVFAPFSAAGVESAVTGEAAGSTGIAEGGAGGGGGGTV
jgi:hypothetical protein